MDNEAAFVNKGILALEKGDLKKAMLFFQASLAARQNADAHFGLAVCHHNLGETAKARACAQAAAELGCGQARDYLDLHPEEAGAAGGPSADAPPPSPAGKAAARPSSGVSASDMADAFSGAAVGRESGAPAFDGDAEADLRLFIGRNSDFYIGKFARIEEARAAARSPHSSARGKRASFGTYSPGFRIYLACIFLSAPAYLLYRKMYLPALAVFTANVVLAQFLPSMAAGILNVLVAPGLIPLYKWHATRKIREIDARGLTGSARASKLRKSGGVNVVFPAMYLAAMLAILACAVRLLLNQLSPYPG